MTVDLSVVMPVLASLTVVIGASFAALMWVRRWIQKVAVSTQRAERQLKTSNGKTVADYVEGTARDITRINGHIEDLGKVAAENRETSIAALTLARHLNERFDQHLVHEHGVQNPTRNEET